MSVRVESKIESPFLYRVLKIDGLFALISGILLILFSGPIASLFDIAFPIVLVVIGVSLLAYGAFLLSFTKQGSENHTVATIAIILNTSWVALSFIGLLFGWFNLNLAGKWAIALVAEAVIIFGVLEFIGLSRERKGFQGMEIDNDLRINS